MKELIKYLRLKWVGLKGRVEDKSIASFKIRALLEKKFEGSYIELVDSYYNTCDYRMAKLISGLMPIRFMKYKKEVNDCDDFARAFWFVSKLLFPSLPVGYCHVKTKKGKHALNFIVYHFKGSPRFSFIEPQSGKMSNFQYKPYLVIV